MKYSVKIKLILLSCFLAPVLSAQEQITKEINWYSLATLDLDSNVIHRLSFDGAYYAQQNDLPHIIQKIRLENNENINASVAFYHSSPVLEEEFPELFKKRLSSHQPEINITYVYERKVKYAVVVITPFVSTDGKPEKVETLVIKTERVAGSQVFGKGGAFGWKSESLLNSGDWFKLTINQTGIYGLSHSYLTGQVGIGVTGIDHSRIRMYGYGGGMLPEANSQTIYDDLVEIPIKIQDNNNNGFFDAGDMVLFYAEGADKWKYENGDYSYVKNLYSNVAAYFITIGSPGGKRISIQPSSAQAPDYITSDFEELIHNETEKYNIIKSGKLWFGYEFDKVLSYDFPINLSEAVPGSTARFKSRASGRGEVPNTLITRLNGNVLLSSTFSPVSLIYEREYASDPNIAGANFQVNSENITLNYSLTKASSVSKAWLDYFDIIYLRHLNVGNQTRFRDSRGIGPGKITRFNLISAQQPEVWEISDIHQVKQQAVQNSGNTYFFNVESDSLREFVAFKGAFLEPVSASKVANQNLHGIRNIDYVIISHSTFTAAANKLADFHRQRGLSVAVVNPENIYNEFSSGVQDISAIRNFLRMLYDESASGKEPKYLLLFGDASFDYKGILPNNTNYVPTFESLYSLSPTGSFCADDFFGLLDENEGGDIIQGKVDLGIGRFPVQTATEADNMVNKVLAYHEKEGLGEWRNNVYIFADDEDGNDHLEDGEIYSDIVENDYPEFNVKKIYADAYKQVSIGSAQRYYEVKEAFNTAFNTGALVINYSGHGGELGLGHENYLDIPQINAWENKNKLPLFITATCEFSRFDDPARQSAGEYVILHPKGGAIAMLTTVRLVYSSPNQELNTNFYKNNAFVHNSGERPSIGEIYMMTKNATGASVNARSFTLLGDPALVLAYPKHKVLTTEMKNLHNGVETDSFNALSVVNASGEVRDHSGNLLGDFNGEVDVTVYGSKQTLKTLKNDPGSDVQEFEAFNSLIYKGKVSVKSGKFNYNFIIPRDVPIKSGFGKISYYAQNGITDANGYETLFISPQEDSNAGVDFTGPSVRVFMNDTTFRFGGLTDESPNLLALVYDEHGINTTGNGIGRDLTALLDNNGKNQLILNEHYQANLDDYQSGTITYPLKNLADGKHSIKVKVWDVYNNSGEGYTEFIVASSEEIALQNLMNYPNPFIDSTKFYFDHNKKGETLFIRIDIFSENGKHVKTLSTKVENADDSFTGLSWNGDTDGGSRLQSGMYFYRVNVMTSTGQDVLQTERLVIIR